MKIFGKERDSLRIKGITAARAVYVNQDVQEVEIRFVTEEGQHLALQLPARFMPGFITELTNAYEAINPPLHRGTQASQWNGMD